MKKFCERLRDTRQRLGMNGQEVAERIGVSRNYIYALEKARKNPSLETVIKLSDVYREPSLVDHFMRISAKMSNLDGDFYDAGLIATYRMRADEIMKRNKEAYKEASDFFRHFFDKYEKPTE